MRVRALRVAFWVVLGGVLCEAQIPQGAMVGRVTDPAGAAIVGSDVTLENQATGVSRASVTNAEGLYAFNYLESGLFRLIVKAAGFNTGVYPDIRVQAGDKLRLDAQLQLGDVTTTIEVTGAGSLIQTEAATVAHTVTQREVIDLPVRDREFSQLAILVVLIQTSC